jgi:tetratricopeptide (TPR) repeat protein
MMEQAEASAPAALAVGSLKVALSDDARASLEAVRVAQAAARQRARQETRRARFFFATGLAAAVLLVAGLGPRLARWRHAHRQAPIATPTSAAPLPAPPPTARAADTLMLQASGPAGAEAHSAAPAATVKLPATDDAPAESAGRSEQGCDLAAVGSAAWRVSPEACARAFNAHPTDPALALAVAQAEHARGHLTEAARWARRALALDPKAAEAYVLIARADLDDGRREEAGAAYRHYLELAPRGWHHAEARRALGPTRARGASAPSADR